MKKPFTIVAVVLLALVALLQLLRLGMGWEIVVEGTVVPLWASGVAALVAAGVAVMVWLETRK